MRDMSAGRVRPAAARRLCWGLTLCCALLPGAAVAAEAALETTAGPGEPDYAAMSMEELGRLKVPTVYGASRFAQKSTEAPASVTVVTRDDIRRFGYRTLADVLRGVAGFYVTYDRSYDYIGVRGVNRPGDSGGRVLITVDGHRLNDPLYDSASARLDFLLDVDLIESIEVIRGPVQSLYAKNAFFAVINVIPRKGSDLGGAEISGAAATFDAYSGRVSYGSKLASGTEWMLSGSFYDSAGNPRLYFPEFADIHDGVAENMDGERAKSAFTSVFWKDLSLEVGYVSRDKTWPTAEYSTDDAVVIFNDPRFISTDTRAFASLMFRRTLENGWDVAASGYYDYYRYDGQYPYDYLDPLYPVTLNRDVAVSESLGSELHFGKLIFERHRISAGAEGRDDFRLDQKNFDVDPPMTYADLKDSANSLGVYLQDEFRVSRRLILNAAVRYDRFSTFGGTVNPRAAVIYQPQEATTLKFLYGRAFRAPNAYEVYTESNTTKTNPDLGPETIDYDEVICEQAFGKRWRGSASLYHYHIDGLIGLQVDPVDGFTYYGNLGSVTTNGAELAIETRWTGGLFGRASYSYARAEDVGTGERLGNSPEHLGKLNLSVPFRKEKLFASVELQGMSGRATVRGGEVGGFWVANVTLLSRELVKGLEASASVYNVLDRRYSDPVADDFTQDAIEQDGRTFRVKLSYRF